MDTTYIQDFNFIVDTIEKDHPGFHINVTQANKQEYHLFKERLLAKLKTSHDSTHGVKVFTEYLSFFKDKHLKIYDPLVVDEAGYIKNLLIAKVPKITSFTTDEVWIQLPSFNFRLVRKLDRFYAMLRLLVKHKHMVIDLRGNSGGGERMYYKLVRILKKRPRKLKSIVLTDGYTASAAEDFVLKVRKLSNVLIMGNATSGQVAYGDIKGVLTPNHQFKLIIPTALHKNKLGYEFTGISPDKLLDFHNDWRLEVHAQLFDI